MIYEKNCRVCFDLREEDSDSYMSYYTDITHEKYLEVSSILSDFSFEQDKILNSTGIEDQPEKNSYRIEVSLRSSIEKVQRSFEVNKKMFVSLLSTVGFLNTLT